MEPIQNELGMLVKGAAFAADRHRHQRRKGADPIPYINHPLEVADILATDCGVTDLTTLLAAVLHDTIEDTPTSPEEIETAFGRDVRLLVEEVTDDKQLSKGVRKRLQIERAPSLSPAAKQIRIADKISNLRDLVRNPPADWPTRLCREYVDWGELVVAGCRGVSQRLERLFDATVQSARRHLQ